MKKQYKVTDNLVFEDINLIFKNFTGQEDRFNPPGSRRFSVLIEDPTMAANLLEIGWNVKPLKRDEEEEPAWHLPVKVNYTNGRPPTVIVVQENGQLPLTEDTVAMLDYRSIISCDLVISPYNWDKEGDSPVSAYLRTMYAHLEDTPFSQKYADLPIIHIGPRSE